MSVPTFVVGTGRCGSTMLSNMLREHPKVLSLSEFFSNLVDNERDPFSADDIDATGFWQILSAVTAFSRFFLQHGLTFPEWIYPLGAPGVRFSRETGVPAILKATLPHLTDGFDELFDVLRDEVARFPTAPLRDQYTRLFDWLLDRFDKCLWVERSGASFLWGEQLFSMFPEARFIHIVRDGRDAAISMQAHEAIRFLVVMRMIGESLGADPFASADRAYADRLPAELRSFLPEQFNASAFRNFRVPLEQCGGFWSQELDDGLKVLRRLPADRLLTLRYEDFFVDAERQLAALAAFLGDEFVDESWSARCAATVRPPRSTWRDLPDEELRAVTEACRPGFEQLAAVGIHYAV